MPKKFEVHPSIGIARVGNSTDCFVGADPDEPRPQTYRDRRGRLLRQAARFRIYECDRTVGGRLRSATEVTLDNGRIEWTVHLANTKAEGQAFASRGSARRNDNETNRSRLIIDPGERTLSGPNGRAAFDTGRFRARDVPLGEIRTEADGRLLVLGGFGKSDAVRLDGRPPRIDEFADNDDWYDDVSDGPVRATVTLPNGKKEAARPAWVVVGPPDFAPHVTNLVTLYDVAYDVAVAKRWHKVPAKASFRQHVQPILERTVGYQWVIKQARLRHGRDTHGDFTAQLDDLADPTQPTAVRQRIVRRLRDPNGPPVTELTRMPRLHDASMSFQVMPLTPTQYKLLKLWEAGKFVDDREDDPPEEHEPDRLDRVALESCTGGPFYPGMEASDVLANPANYAGPFVLDPARFVPGDVTRNLAVPWQADFWACSRDSQFDLGWWPAHRPDQVFPRVDADEMVEWNRGVVSDDDLVTKWPELGIVVERRGADGVPVFVESERRLRLPR